MPTRKRTQGYNHAVWVEDLTLQLTQNRNAATTSIDLSLLTSNTIILCLVIKQLRAALYAYISHIQASRTRYKLSSWEQL